MSSCGRLWKYRSDNNNGMQYCGIVICKRVIYRTDVLCITLSLQKDTYSEKYFSLMCSTGISCPVHSSKAAAPW